mmetsp:Transcript_23280/g.38919  ORF Transcript_23280/g.38919 Transcript_23280/m.38919 type:complete len:232 (-) Transcript_23280:380-1075(-)
MRPAYKVEIVLLQKFCHAVSPEGVRNSSVVLAPPLNVLVRVRPQQIAQQSSVRHIRRTRDLLNLLQRLQVWREASMHAQDLLIHQRGHRQAVEAVCERLPEANVVAALALVVKPIDAVDRSTLMVASQQEEILGVLNLVREQEADSLQALLAAVDIIPKEQVVCLRWKPTVFEQAEEVRVLPVDITADLYRGLQLEQVRLILKNLAGGHAELTDVVFRELNLLSWASIANV